MSLTVPYLPDAEIDARANVLLADYARRKGVETELPIPVDAILEDHLELHLGFDDLCSRLGAPDVLGALWIETREVIVDQTLDPSEQSFVLPRYRFTLGHEIGHWQLHRRLLLTQRLQDDLFQQATTAPSIICRSGQRRERIEWQADAFAAALLMPRPAVTMHWQRLMGPERLKVSGLKGRGEAFLVAAALAGGSLGGDAQDQQNDMIETMIRPLAEAFEVSRPAMRIRLEQLGFIVHDAEPTFSLFEAV